MVNTNIIETRTLQHTRAMRCFPRLNNPAKKETSRAVKKIMLTTASKTCKTGLMDSAPAPSSRSTSRSRVEKGQRVREMLHAMEQHRKEFQIRVRNFKKQVEEFQAKHRPRINEITPVINNDFHTQSFSMERAALNSVSARLAVWSLWIRFFYPVCRYTHSTR